MISDPKNKLTINEFAAKIKSKYSQYQGMDDAQLVDAILKKYPEYASQIQTGTTPELTPQVGTIAPPVSVDGTPDSKVVGLGSSAQSTPEYTEDTYTDHHKAPTPQPAQPGLRQVPADKPVPEQQPMPKLGANGGYSHAPTALPTDVDGRIAQLNKQIQQASAFQPSAGISSPEVQAMRAEVARLRDQQLTDQAVQEIREADGDDGIMDKALSTLTGDDIEGYFVSPEKKKQVKKQLQQVFSLSDRASDMVLNQFEMDNKRDAFYIKGMEGFSPVHDQEKLRDADSYGLHGIADLARQEGVSFLRDKEKEVAQAFDELKQMNETGDIDPKREKELRELITKAGFNPDRYKQYKSGSLSTNQQGQEDEPQVPQGMTAHEYLNTAQLSEQNPQELANYINLAVQQLEKHPRADINTTNEKNYVIYKHLEKRLGEKLGERTVHTNASPYNIRESPEQKAILDEIEGLQQEYLRAKAMFAASSRMVLLREAAEEVEHKAGQKAHLFIKGFTDALLGPLAADQLWGTDVVQRNGALMEVLQGDGIQLTPDAIKVLEATPWENFFSGVGHIGGVVTELGVLNAIGGTLGIPKAIQGIGKMKSLGGWAKPLQYTAEMAYADAQFQMIGSEPGTGAAFHMSMKAFHALPLMRQIRLMGDAMTNRIASETGKKAILYGTEFTGQAIHAGIAMTTSSQFVDFLHATANSLSKDKEFSYEIEKRFGGNWSDYQKRLISEISLNWIFGVHAMLPLTTAKVREQKAREYERMATELRYRGYEREAEFVESMAGEINNSLTASRLAATEGRIVNTVEKDIFGGNKPLYIFTDKDGNISPFSKEKFQKVVDQPWFEEAYRNGEININIRNDEGMMNWFMNKFHAPKSAPKQITGGISEPIPTPATPHPDAPISRNMAEQAGKVQDSRWAIEGTTNKDTGRPTIITLPVGKDGETANFYLVKGSPETVMYVIPIENPSAPPIPFNPKENPGYVVTEVDPVLHADLITSQVAPDGPPQTQVPVIPPEIVTNLYPGKEFILEGTPGVIVSAQTPYQGIEVQMQGSDQLIMISPEQYTAIEFAPTQTELEYKRMSDEQLTEQLLSSQDEAQITAVEQEIERRIAETTPELPQQPTETPQTPELTQPQGDITGVPPTQPQAQQPQTLQVGKKTFQMQDQGDGSVFIPFEPGKDETKTVRDYVDTDAYEVIPVTEEQPIEGVPAFAKVKTNKILKGVIIQPKPIKPEKPAKKETLIPTTDAKEEEERQPEPSPRQPGQSESVKAEQETEQEKGKEEITSLPVPPAGEQPTADSPVKAGAVSPKVPIQENKIQSWIDKWNEIKERNDTTELDNFYNKVKVALNGYAQGKNVVDEFEALKKEIEDYTVDRKKTPKQSIQQPPAAPPQSDKVAGADAGVVTKPEKPKGKKVFTDKKGNTVNIDNGVLYFYDQDGNIIPEYLTKRVEENVKGKVIIKNVDYLNRVTSNLRGEYRKNIPLNVGRSAFDVSKAKIEAGEISEGDMRDITMEEYIATYSENPGEILIWAEKTPRYLPEEMLDIHDRMIANHLGSVTPQSFYRHGDRNKVTGSMARAYFRKDGQGIDQVVQSANSELAGELAGFDQEKITTNDVVDFMVRYPNGAASFYKQKSLDYIGLEERFMSLTGTQITPTLINRIRAEKKQVEDALYKSGTITIEGVKDLTEYTDDGLLDLISEIEGLESWQQFNDIIDNLGVLLEIDPKEYYDDLTPTDYDTDRTTQGDATKGISQEGSRTGDGGRQAVPHTSGEVQGTEGEGKAGAGKPEFAGEVITPLERYFLQKEDDYSHLPENKQRAIKEIKADYEPKIVALLEDVSRLEDNRNHAITKEVKKLQGRIDIFGLDDRKKDPTKPGMFDTQVETVTQETFTQSLDKFKKDYDNKVQALRQEVEDLLTEQRAKIRALAAQGEMTFEKPGEAAPTIDDVLFPKEEITPKEAEDKSEFAGDVINKPQPKPIKIEELTEPLSESDNPVEGDTSEMSEQEEAEGLELADKIQDFGEKIGMARKDTAERGFKRYKKGDKDMPGWMKKYQIFPQNEIAESPSSRRRSTLEPGKFSLVIVRGEQFKTIKENIDSEQEAYDMIPLIEVALNHRVHKSNKEGDAYSIYRRWSSGKLWEVKKGFKSYEEAMKYMATHPQEIINFKTPRIERPHLDNIERKGIERRKGNVTPEKFMQDFGFRGGEFGNWVAGDERQEMLNLAYDALSDMAEVLGVPPSALSLNSRLAIGFGSRGKGLTGAAAHYEPQRGVINLTKIHGAGSLAHEWFHAMDTYFGIKDNKHFTPDEEGVIPPLRYEREWMSGDMFRNPNVRKEVQKAWKEVWESIAYKTEQSTYDKAQSQKRLGYAIEGVVSDLNSERAWLSRDRNWGLRKKAATPAQLARWDALVERIKAMELGPVMAKKTKKKYSFEREYEVQKLLDELSREISGRGISRLTYQHYNRVEVAKEEKEKADNAETFDRKVPTTFFRDSKEIDKTRSSDYWSTNYEMAARAFEAYMDDALTAAGYKNDYLVHSVSNAIYKMLYDAKPYPEGAEREAINTAFDNFFKVIETKQEDGKTVMFNIEDAPTTAKKVVPLVNEKAEKYIQQNGVYAQATPKQDFPEGVSFISESASGNLPGDAGVRGENNYTATPDDGGVTYMERQLSEKKGITFMGDKLTGPARIKSSRDVAFLFKNLESASTENSFAVLIGPRGAYKVLYISTGSTFATIIDAKHIVAAAKEFNATEVIFVHNHPSGSLVPSPQDKKVHSRINDALSDVDVTLLPSVIINLDSGDYLEFTSTYEDINPLNKGLYESYEVKKRKVYQFDRQKLYIPSSQKTKLTSPADAAEYLSKMKRGTTPKIGAIIVDRLNKINKYILFDETISKEDLAKQLLFEVSKHGESVILSTNTDIERMYIDYISGRLRNIDANLLDVIQSKHGEDVMSSFRSWADEGLLSEPETKYQGTEVRDSASETIKINGKDRPTTNSNGKPIHHTEQGLKNFWEWFGDSKVVDSEGRPLVVYHGSPNKIDTFNPNKAQGWGSGVYFTDNKQQAKEEFGDNLYEVYLNLRNPEVNGFSKSEKAIRTTQAWKEYQDKTKQKANLEEDWMVDYHDAIQEHIEVINRASRELGIDGIISEGSNNIQGTEYVAYYPTQIKSATDNTGDYSPGTPDIRLMVAGEKGAANLDKAEEATTRLDNLGVAREMETAGKVDIKLHEKSKPNDIEKTPTKKEIVVYRTIYVNDISEIDFNEIGNHWTESTVYKHLGKYNPNKKVAKIRAIFNKSDINNDATKVSNEGYPTEKEVVIHKNSNPVQITVQFSNDENNFMYIADRYEVVNANTGTRQDEWVGELDGNYKTGNKENTNKSFTPQQIKLATGWERGADGKWRYEIDDPNVLALKLGKLEAIGDDYSIALSDILDYPELYKAYPELKDLSVELDSDLESIGEYGDDIIRMKLSQSMSANDTNTGIIQLIANGLSKIPIIKNRVNGKIKAESGYYTTLLHEIQHAIQEIEGFARGGNTDTALAQTNTELLALDKQIDGLRTQQDDLIKQGIDGYDTRYQDIVSEIKKLSDIQQRIIDSEVAKGGDIKTYQNLAGEVESRNVEKRQDYTAEKRRETLLKDTEDVAREDQIILREGLGVSQSIESPTDTHQTISQALQALNDHASNSNPITVVKSMPDIPQAMKDNNEDIKDIDIVNSHITRGAKISAFHSPASGITYYVSDVMAEYGRDPVELWLHEQGVHMGMDLLFENKEQKTEFLNKVYEKIGEEGFKAIFTTGSTYDSYKNLSPSAKAEEYMARLTEKMDKGELLTKKEKNFWQWIIDQIRRIINRIIKGKTNITDEMIEDVIRASVQNVVGYESKGKRGKGKTVINSIPELFEGTGVKTGTRGLAVSDPHAPGGKVATGQAGKGKAGEPRHSIEQIRFNIEPDSPADRKPKMLIDYLNDIRDLKEQLSEKGEKGKQALRREVVEDFIRNNRDGLTKIDPKRVPAILNKINRAARTDKSLATAIASLDKIVKEGLDKLAHRKAKVFIKSLKSIKTRNKVGGVVRAANLLHEGVDIRDAVLEIAQMDAMEIETLKRDIESILEAEDDILGGFGANEALLNKVTDMYYLQELADTFGNLEHRSLQDVENAIQYWGGDFARLKADFKEFMKAKRERMKELQQGMVKDVTGGKDRLWKIKMEDVVSDKDRRGGDGKVSEYQSMMGTIASLTHAIWRGFHAGQKSKEFFGSGLFRMYKDVDRAVSAKTQMQQDMKRKVSDFITDIWDSKKQFTEEMKQEIKITLDIGSRDDKGEVIRDADGKAVMTGRTISISTGKAIDMWLQWQSVTGKRYMDRIDYQSDQHTMTEDTFKELDEALSDNMKAWGERMQAEFFGHDDYYNAANAVLHRATGRRLPRLAGYIPVAANSSRNQIPYDVNSFGIHKSFVNERRYGNYDLDRNDLFGKAMKYADGVSSYVHLAEPMSDLAYTLNSKRVQSALKAMDTNGKAQRIIDLLNKGYNEQRTDGQRWYAWPLRRFVNTKILMNYGLWGKQLTSFITMLDSDFGDPTKVLHEFTRYMTGTSDKEVLAIVKDIYHNHPDLRYRNIVDIESLTRIDKLQFHTHMFGDSKTDVAKGVTVTALWNPTAVGDRVAIQMGGIPVMMVNYKAGLEEAQALGMTPEQAKAFAARKAIDILAEFIGTTQQSGKLTHKSAVQYGGWRTTTAFMNAVMGYARKLQRHSRDVLRDYKAGQKRRIDDGEDPFEARWKAFADVEPNKLFNVLLYGSILPLFWSVATTLGGSITRLWDDDEDERKKARIKLLFDSTLAWTKGLFGIGFLLEYGLSKALDETYGKRDDNIVPVLDDTLDLMDALAATIKKVSKYNDETIKQGTEDEQKLYKTLAKLGITGAGLAVGAPVTFLHRLFDVSTAKEYDNTLRVIARLYGIPKAEIERIFDENPLFIVDETVQEYYDKSLFEYLDKVGELKAEEGKELEVLKEARRFEAYHQYDTKDKQTLHDINIFLTQTNNDKKARYAMKRYGEYTGAKEFSEQFIHNYTKPLGSYYYVTKEGKTYDGEITPIVSPALTDKIMEFVSIEIDRSDKSKDRKVTEIEDLMKYNDMSDTQHDKMQERLNKIKKQK